MDAIDLRGAAVVITGAGRGIGRETAAEFASRGARVCVGDIDADAAERTARELGGDVAGFELDVRSRDSFATFLAESEDAFGPPQVLVNNAGIMPLGPFLDEDDETSRQTIEVNLWGPILGMKLVLPGMVERGGGHVINVASMMGKVHVPGAAVYGASKYALVGLNATVRDELNRTGVTATAVLPGIVRTELISGHLDSPRAAARRARAGCEGDRGLVQGQAARGPHPALVRRLRTRHRAASATRDGGHPPPAR